MIVVYWFVRSTSAPHTLFLSLKRHALLYLGPYEITYQSTPQYQVDLRLVELLGYKISPFFVSGLGYFRYFRSLNSALIGFYP